MALEGRAGIEIGITGSDKATAELQKIERAAKAGATAMRNEWARMGNEVKSIAAGVGNDLKGAFSPNVSFSGARAGIEAYAAAVSQMSVATGRSFELEQARIEAVAKKIGATRAEAQRFIETTTKATYDRDAAEANAPAFQKFARATGRSLAETAPLAGAFATMGVERPTEMLTQIETASKRYGTRGGQAALADQIAALAPQLAKTSLTSAQKVNLVASLGKGLPDAQAREIQSQFISSLESQAPQLEAHYRRTGALGRTESLYDQEGRLDLLKAADLRQRELSKKFTKDTATRIAANQMAGRQGAARFMGTDLEDVAQFVGHGGTTFEDLQKRWEATPGGQKAKSVALMESAMYDRQGPGSLLWKENERQARLAAENPMIYSAIQRLPLGGDVVAMDYMRRMDTLQQRGVGKTFRDVYSADSGLTFSERTGLGYGLTDVGYGVTNRVRPTEPIPSVGTDEAPLKPLMLQGGGTDTAEITKAIKDGFAEQRPVEVRVADATTQGVQVVQPGGQQ